MNYLDMKTWNRRDHFRFFRRMELQTFNICANVDITALLPFVKSHNASLFRTIVYAVVRSANEVKEFRYRIRGRRVVEHAVVHASFTHLSGDDAFGFCNVRYDPDIRAFFTAVEVETQRLMLGEKLSEPPSLDEYVFMTCIPWISFTSITHPGRLRRADSNPRIAWGKYFQSGERTLMPFSVQANHALMDGIHVGTLYETLQAYFDEPERLYVQ